MTEDITAAEILLSLKKASEFAYTVNHRISKEMLIPHYELFDWEFIRDEFPKILTTELLTNEEFLHSQFHELRKQWPWLETHNSENLKHIRGKPTDLLIKLNNTKETIDYLCICSFVGSPLFEITLNEETNTSSDIEEVIYSLKTLLRKFLGRTVEDDESNANIITAAIYDLQSLSEGIR